MGGGKSADIYAGGKINTRDTISLRDPPRAHMVDLSTMQGSRIIDSLLYTHTPSHSYGIISPTRSNSTSPRFTMYGPPEAEQGFERPKSGARRHARVSAARPGPDPGHFCCHRTPPRAQARRPPTTLSRACVACRRRWSPWHFGSAFTPSSPHSLRIPPPACREGRRCCLRRLSLGPAVFPRMTRACCLPRDALVAAPGP